MRIVDEIDRVKWGALVDESAVATYFQTPACYAFYESLPFMDGFAYGVEDDEGRLLAVICGYVVADGGRVKRWFSRRAIVPGGVLVADDCDREALALLLNHAKRALKRKAIYVEVRNYNDYTDWKPVFKDAGFDFMDHLNIQVDVLAKDEMLARVSEPKQRQIRAAERRGVEVVEAREASEVKAYYAVLSELYRTKVRKPLFPEVFFQELVKLPDAKLLLTKEDGQVTGGMVVVELAGRTVYEWFVCGEVMATWAGIAYAADRGVKRFDFMGAGRVDVPYSVRDFKKQFGGKLVDDGRFLYVCNALLYKVGKLVVSVI